MALKIRPEHLAHIRVALTIAAVGFPSRAAYAARDPSIPRIDCAQDPDRRYRWDLLAASSISSNWICDELYPHLNNDHIDSALRTVVQELAP